VLTPTDLVAAIVPQGAVNEVTVKVARIIHRAQPTVVSPRCRPHQAVVSEAR
jgi:hypothetical protein